MLSQGQRATLDDLEKARGFIAKLREQEPSLLRTVEFSRSKKPSVMTEDELIAETWREVRDWKRKHLYSGRGWFRW